MDVSTLAFQPPSRDLSAVYELFREEESLKWTAVDHSDPFASFHRLRGVMSPRASAQPFKPNPFLVDHRERRPVSTQGCISIPYICLEPSTQTRFDNGLTGEFKDCCIVLFHSNAEDIFSALELGRSLRDCFNVA